MPLRQRWLFAAKLASWPKLLVPMGLGQALGLCALTRLGGELGSHGWAQLAIGVLLTLLNLGYLVFLNDVGDRRVDGLKRRMFPEGCSPKTIPDGILSPRALAWAGLSCLSAHILISAIWAQLADRPQLLWFSLGTALMFACYGWVAPKLNYRGGGELLEAAGTGCVLPWAQFYLVAGTLYGRELWYLLGLTCFGLASALASGLSDECSDRLGGKVTFTTMWGNAAVRRAVRACAGAACVAWAGCFYWVGGVDVPIWGRVVVLVVAIGGIRRMQSHAPAATTNAFGALASYKRELHRAIWWSSSALSIILCARAFSLLAVCPR